MDDLAEAAEMAEALLKEHDAFSGRASDTITALLARIATMKKDLEIAQAVSDRDRLVREAAMSEVRRLRDAIQVALDDAVADEMDEWFAGLMQASRLKPRRPQG